MNFHAVICSFFVLLPPLCDGLHRKTCVDFSSNTSLFSENNFITKSICIASRENNYACGV